MTRVYVSIGSNIEPDYHVRAAVRPCASASASWSSPPSTATRRWASTATTSTTWRWASTPTLSPRHSPTGSASWRPSTAGAAARQVAARTLDLDLLTWDQAVIDRPGLRLPRDEILRYAFVLKPLADIAGDEHHPELHRSYRDLWADFQGEHEGMTRLELTP